MNSFQLLTFTAVYCVAVATPGPGIAALIARVLKQGLNGILAMIAGFVIGDLIWFTLAAAGLAVIAQTLNWVFLLVKYGGAGYLALLAWKMLTTPVFAVTPDVSNPRLASLPLFLSMLSLTLGNPKVIVFFLSIMPLVVDVSQLSVHIYLVLASTLIITLSVILLFYALLAHQARALFRSARALTWLNRGVACVLFGAATMIALR